MITAIRWGLQRLLKKGDYGDNTNTDDTYE